jgi:ribosome biogenesis GTPase
MQHTQKQRLQALLQNLSPDEQRKLFQRAAKHRKDHNQSQKRLPGARSSHHRQPQHEDEVEGFVSFKRGNHLSLEETVLQLLEQDLANPHSPGSPELAMLLGQVIQLGSGCCKVQKDGETIECRLQKDLIQAQKTGIAVGDAVFFKKTDSEAGLVLSISPRKTVLSRPDPHNPHLQRIIAANADFAVILTSFRDPPFRPGLVDRFLIALGQSNIRPILVVNKIDLLETKDDLETELAGIEPYEGIGIPIFTVSARTGEGIDRLVAALEGKLGVVLGHSGVGKSSFINCLKPTKVLATNGIRQSDRKGRHTTTGAELLETGSGIRIIDTPGIREFGLWDMDMPTIQQGFREFSSFAETCRFRDCSHTHEGDCGVKEAVRQRKIHPLRYRSYCRILTAESDEAEESPASFKCGHCSFIVSCEAEGTKQRNHCPTCLWSKHLDALPGDRLAACGGQMEPVSVWVKSKGEWALIHRCLSCGAFHSNRVAGDDNELKLMSLAIKPLAQPPFPLDGLHRITRGSAS